MCKYSKDYMPNKAVNFLSLFTVDLMIDFSTQGWLGILKRIGKKEIINDYV